MLSIGSLFSGIGGLELGLEAALPGSRTLWQVEKEPYARAVLAKHWPEVSRYEDVRTVGVANLEPVDLLCGGFPCQEISIAGKGEGLSGKSSGLWWEFARIIRELLPPIVVLENVPALTARGLAAVLGTLAASGYDAQWDCISAASVGAWHRRNRIFIVAYSNGESVRDDQQRDTQKRRRIQDQGDSVSSYYGEARQVDRSAFKRREAWAVEPAMGRVADGVPGRVDRLRCLGNAVVPQVAYVVGLKVREIIETELASNRAHG